MSETPQKIHVPEISKIHPAAFFYLCCALCWTKYNINRFHVLLSRCWIMTWISTNFWLICKVNIFETCKILHNSGGLIWEINLNQKAHVYVAQMVGCSDVISPVLIRPNGAGRLISTAATSEGSPTQTFTAPGLIERPFAQMYRGCILIWMTHSSECFCFFHPACLYSFSLLKF